MSAVQTFCPEGRPQIFAPFLEFGGTLPDGTHWVSCPCGMVHYRPNHWAAPGRTWLEEPAWRKLTLWRLWPLRWRGALWSWIEEQTRTG